MEWEKYFNMDKVKIKEIANDVKNKSNNDLISARDFLYVEFEKTKKLIVDLTRHIEAIEEYYEKINKEIGIRLGKNENN